MPLHDSQVGMTACFHSPSLKTHHILYSLLKPKYLSLTDARDTILVFLRHTYVFCNPTLLHSAKIDLIVLPGFKVYTSTLTVTGTTSMESNTYSCVVKPPNEDTFKLTSTPATFYRIGEQFHISNCCKQISMPTCLT